MFSKLPVAAAFGACALSTSAFAVEWNCQNRTDGLQVLQGERQTSATFRGAALNISDVRLLRLNSGERRLEAKVYGPESWQTPSRSREGWLTILFNRNANRYEASIRRLDTQVGEFETFPFWTRPCELPKD